MNRKHVVLMTLLGVLAACLLYAYFATPRLEKAPPRAASKRVSPAASAAGDQQPSATQERISFDFMQVEPEEFPGAKRDIFRFGARVIEKAAPPKPTPVEKVIIPPEPEPEPEPVPVAVVNEALAQFTFLGFLEKSGEKTIFLSSDDNLFLVKSGERFGVEKEFVVAAIADNLLTVRHAGRDALIEIPLIEKQKLNASVSRPARVQPERVQQRSRVIAPQRMMPRPTTPEESEATFPELNEEINPVQEQGSEEPARGDVIEGDTNGTNQ